MKTEDNVTLYKWEDICSGSGCEDYNGAFAVIGIKSGLLEPHVRRIAINFKIIGLHLWIKWEDQFEW